MPATKICKACGAKYQYPVPRALSTRFHCEDCAELDGRVRRALERLMREVHQLSDRVRALEGKVD